MPDGNDDDDDDDGVYDDEDYDGHNTVDVDLAPKYEGAVI